MLRILKNVMAVDVPQLVNLYRNSLKNEKEIDRFYEYLQSVFFLQSDAFCAVWVVDGQYISALRCEPYEDGYLITGLETDPEYRRKGYAAQLLKNVIAFLNSRDMIPIYSHVLAGNEASLKLHYDCGFAFKFGFARLLDATVSTRYVTLCNRKQVRSLTV